MYMKNDTATQLPIPDSLTDEHIDMHKEDSPGIVLMKLLIAIHLLPLLYWLYIVVKKY